jgi:hypothetical protein
VKETSAGKEQQNLGGEEVEVMREAGVFVHSDLGRKGQMAGMVCGWILLPDSGEFLPLISPRL